MDRVAKLLYRKSVSFLRYACIHTNPQYKKLIYTAYIHIISLVVHCFWSLEFMKTGRLNRFLKLNGENPMAAILWHSLLGQQLYTTADNYCNLEPAFSWIVYNELFVKLVCSDSIEYFIYAQHTPCAHWNIGLCTGKYNLIYLGNMCGPSSIIYLVGKYDHAKHLRMWIRLFTLMVYTLKHFSTNGLFQIKTYTWDIFQTPSC